ncbi:MarR family transcriptional regulator [Ruegeria conchae]|uniref:MarR family winged helix-turn-helix transcriptional regulator n=1 Tax=Ruegeria conchae TaxID=981384 RepID=UPI0021A55874|nr:MarR family transcriptional regulator [Ruegeria conchae]UWR03814.1 MarR family transcriptional regulator [Ruegeria conchae]
MTQQNNDEKDEFDLRNFLPFLLNQAAEESSLEFQRVYKNRYGMLRTEWRVLFHLGNYGELTAKEIGLRAKIHKTKVSRAVRKLEQRRYLKRTRDENDRRVERLTLTTSGQSVYRELRGIASDYDAKLAAHFTTGEAALLRMMLRRLAGME